MNYQASLQCNCRSALACICLFAILVSAIGLASASDSSQSITAAGNKIVNELEHKDFAAFGKDVSSEGLLIVRREPDWNKSNVPLKDYPVNSRHRYLSFNRMKTVVWKEYEVSFAKPDLSNRNYVSLLKQFRLLIIASHQDYHDLTASNETEDGFWFYERRLGPAIFGKLGSDECIFIYLKDEGGKWKVWRMEFWERGAPQHDNK